MSNETLRKPWLYQTGQRSANPGGRPKGLAARIRELTSGGEAILEGLLDLAQSPDPKIRLETYKILLDRGYGKALEITANANLDVGTSEIGAEILAALGGQDLSELARAISTGYKSQPVELGCNQDTVPALPASQSTVTVEPISQDCRNVEIQHLPGPETPESDHGPALDVLDSLAPPPDPPRELRPLPAKGAKRKGQGRG